MLFRSDGATVNEKPVDKFVDETLATLEAMENVTTLLPILSSDEVAAEIIYDGPIHAPVLKGDELAKLVITPEGLPELEIPLYAAEDVPTGGFMIRLKTVSMVLLARLQAGPDADLASEG